MEMNLDLGTLLNDTQKVNTDPLAPRPAMPVSHAITVLASTIAV
jgi:hypothetical protein